MMHRAKSRKSIEPGSLISKMLNDMGLSTYSIRNSHTQREAETCSRDREASHPGTEPVILVPGKGWFVLFRFYGPFEPFFDKSWKPGDIVQTSAAK
jgi:hypothetical protein